MAIIRKVGNLRDMVFSILKEEYAHTVLNEITSKEAKEKFYKTIDDKLYGTIISLDPTYNVEKDIMGSYTKWLLRPDNLAKLKQTKEEDFYKIKDDLIKFNKLKVTNKLPLELRDINKFNLDKLLEYIFNNYSDDVSTSKTQDMKNVKANVEKYDFPEWTVIVPQTEEASCYYGKGTRWCTAADHNNYFDSYNSRGKLWILINKRDPSEKYQLHFEDGQFMDVMDREYPLKEILDSDDKLYNFFVERYKDQIIDHAIKNGQFDLFDDIYSNKDYDLDQKTDIVTNILDKASDCNYSPYDYFSILDRIDGISEMSIRKDKNSLYAYTMACLIRNDYYGDEESVIQDVMWLINIFGGIKDIDDMEVLYDIIYKENPELFTDIIKQMNLGELFKKFVNYNDLEGKIHVNSEILSVISDLKEKFKTYPIIQNKIVKIEIKDVDYENNKMKIDLGLKNGRGQIVKKYSGVIDYKSIYDYINNYKLMMDGAINNKPLV